MARKYVFNPLKIRFRPNTKLPTNATSKSKKMVRSYFYPYPKKKLLPQPTPNPSPVRALTADPVLYLLSGGARLRASFRAPTPVLP
jgi:hypothetical protein